MKTLIALCLLLAPASARAAALSPKEQLGKDLFFDKNLSANRNQSCAACHAPETGWTGPDQAINKKGAVYEASVPGLFGNRKPPTIAYAWAPPLSEKKGEFVGGSFWDGRADGRRLGDPLAEQAEGPPLNPLEQALPDAAEAVARIRGSAYAELFRQVWGQGALDDPKAAYDDAGRAIAAYERSREVSPFSSKYDAYLDGKAQLSEREKRGLELFAGKAKCASCHSLARGPHGEHPLFTDFSYANLGLPRNPENPFYANKKANPDGLKWVDPGLGGYLAAVPQWSGLAEDQRGKHKVPTLRNVDKRPSDNFVKAYGHNGYFKSLKEVVFFYNTRDRGGWSPPELADNMTKDTGDLRLDGHEEDALVAFLAALTDGYYDPEAKP